MKNNVSSFYILVLGSSLLSLLLMGFCCWFLAGFFGLGLSEGDGARGGVSARLEGRVGGYEGDLAGRGRWSCDDA